MLKSTGKFVKLLKDWSVKLPANTYEVFSDDDDNFILDSDGDRRSTIFDYPEEFEWVDNPNKPSEFNLLDFKFAYAPTISNQPIKIEFADSDIYPLTLNSHCYTKEGKHYIEANNPIAFPATQEWYEKLKPIYPDLELPVKKLTGKEIAIQILKYVNTVLTQSLSSDNVFNPTGTWSFKNKEELQNIKNHVVLNPYTLKPITTVEEYFTVPTLEIPF